MKLQNQPYIRVTIEVSTTLQKKMEITTFILSDHKGIKLDINSNRKKRKYTNPWEVNNILQDESWVNGETKEEV